MRLLHDEQIESFAHEALGPRLDRQGLCGLEDKTFKVLITDRRPVLADPPPKLAVRLVTKMRAPFKMPVERRLRQLFALVSRLGCIADGIFGDVASDVADFGLLKRRIASIRIDGCEGVDYLRLA